MTAKTMKSKLSWQLITLLITAGLIVLNEVFIQWATPRGWTTYTAANSGPGLYHDGVVALAIDPQGRVWAGTEDTVSVLAPEGRWTNYETNSGLGNDTVTDVTIDSQGQVWVVTDSKEVRMLTPDGGWMTYTTSAELGNHSVTALAVDPQGRVWVGTWRGGLSALIPNGSTYTIANSGLADSDIWSLVIDSQGRVWAGTGGGLSVLAPDGRWTTYTSANSGLAGNGVRALTIDSQGQMWMITDNNEISMLAPDGRWTTLTAVNSGSDIRAMAIDGQGQVWVGTDGGGGGLSVLTPDGTWVTYTTENSGLTQDQVIALTIDKRDRVWIGTFGGLNVFDVQASFPVRVLSFLTVLRGTLIFLGALILVWFIIARWRKRQVSTQPAIPSALEQPPAPVINPATTELSVPPDPGTPTAIPADPNTAFEFGQSLLLSGQRAEAKACFMQVFRTGSPELRQRAVAELEKLGEVESS